MRYRSAVDGMPLPCGTPFGVEKTAYVCDLVSWAGVDGNLLISGSLPMVGKRLCKLATNTIQAPTNNKQIYHD